MQHGRAARSGARGGAVVPPSLGLALGGFGRSSRCTSACQFRKQPAAVRGLARCGGVLILGATNLVEGASAAAAGQGGSGGFVCFGKRQRTPRGRGSGGCNAVVQAEKDTAMKSVEELLHDLGESELRGNALAELSKKREMFDNLAPLMWHSFGSIAILLQEILSVYPALSPPTLTACASSRVCNAVALLQSVASHPETRTCFLKAYIPIYLYPLLNTVSNARAFEYLRLTCLGVIGALVKADDTEAIDFLLQSEIVPLCLRIMETGEELSKTVATYIVERIVLDEAGLRYICFTAERFFALASVLQTMVISLAEQPSTRLLKHIICCYHRLTDHPRALGALQSSFPELLKNGTFDQCLENDPVARNYLQQLLNKLAAPSVEAPQPGPGPAAGGAPHAGPGSSQAGPSRGRRRR